MTTGKTRFLDASDIERGIADMLQLAAQSRVSIALCGGAALQLLGSNRLTKDVDFVASAVPAGLRIEQALSFGGVSAVTPSGTPVDVIVRADDFTALYEAALYHAMSTEGVSPPLRVVTAEYLVAMKMVAGRKRDEADLDFLLTSGIDLSAARAIVHRFLGAYAARDFDLLVMEAQWRQGREDK